MNFVAAGRYYHLLVSSHVAAVDYALHADVDSDVDTAVAVAVVAVVAVVAEVETRVNQKNSMQLMVHHRYDPATLIFTFHCSA